MLRTNIELDEKLVNEAIKLTRKKTKKRACELRPRRTRAKDKEEADPFSRGKGEMDRRPR